VSSDDSSDRSSQFTKSASDTAVRDCIRASGAMVYWGCSNQVTSLLLQQVASLLVSIGIWPRKLAGTGRAIALPKREPPNHVTLADLPLLISSRLARLPACRSTHHPAVTSQNAVSGP
jgi:hypothetical protein